MSDGVAKDRTLGLEGMDQFRLRVARYQFPVKTRPNGWDSNWLTIYGEVQHSGRRWSFQDPCLLTWELSELIEWMKQMPRPSRDLGFMEPNLRFAVPAQSEPWTLAITLSNEAVPENVVNGFTTGHKCVNLLLKTTHEQVNSLVDGLAADLRSFPRR